MLKIFGAIGTGCVLQADQPIVIEGRGRGTVKGELRGGAGALHAESEFAFRLEFPAQRASFQPWTLTLADEDETLTFEGILIGEVWLLTGQSNMEYQVEWIQQRKRVQRELRGRAIRFLRAEFELNEQHRVASFARKEVFEGHWQDADCAGSEQTLSAFGAVFAVHLQRSLKVPVGLIDLSLGGSSIDAWLSPETLAGDAVIRERLSSEEQPYEPETRPSVYADKLWALRHTGFRGALWCLGESAAVYGKFSEAQFFAHCMESLSQCWQGLFGRRFPVITVHIAAQTYLPDPLSVCYVNEALSDHASRHAEVCAVPVYDVLPEWRCEDGRDYYHPIHPVNKYAIGARLARTALGAVYGNEGSPFPSLAELALGARAEVRFDKNVTTSDGREPRGFCVWDGSRMFPARAELDGGRVTVYSPDCRHIAGVAYAFFPYNADCNLTSEKGDPVMPFRSMERGDAASLRYCACEGYTYGLPRMWENCFSGEFGGAGPRPSWEAGRMAGGGISRLCFREGALGFRFSPCARLSYLGGVSPRVRYHGAFNYFFEREEMVFEVKTDGDAALVGVLAEFGINRRYLFAPENGALGGEYRTFRLPLDRALHSYYCPVALEPSERENLCGLQLLFRGRKECTVWIRGFRIV